MRLQQPWGGLVHPLASRTATKTLEPDGVNDYVLRNLQIADTIVEEFNNSSKPFFQGSLPALSCMGTWHRAGHNKFCVG